MVKFSIGNNLKLFLGGTFLIIFTYNFYVANKYKYESSGDAWSFVNLGLSLAKTGNYGHLQISQEDLITDFKNALVGTKEYSFKYHSTWRPPIWSVLIAIIFLVFGYNLTYLLIFKFVLHLLGVFIFYKTLKLLKIKENLVFFGCFLYGVSPAWQLYSRVFLSEPISLFFISLFLFYLIKFLKKKSSFWIQALIAGILILTHPYSIFFPFSVSLFLLIFKKIEIKTVILSGMTCVLIISGWLVRNFLVLDTNSPVLTTSSGAVMAKGWNKKVIEDHTNTKGDLADEELVLVGYIYDKTRAYNEVERSQLYTKAVFHFIKEHPREVPSILLTKIKSAFNPFPETSKPGILETGRIVLHVFSLLALIYCTFFTQSKLIKSLALSLILSTILITSLTYSGFRFRMPQTGLEFLLIIIALNETLDKKRLKI